MLAESHHYFNKAADLLKLSEKIRTILLFPKRTVKVEIVTEDDAGRLMHHIGFRVQHNNTRGPYKGGLRYHPTMDEDHAGGVTVSYFEWAQNIQQYRWERERVNRELEKTMRTAYAAVRETANRHHTGMRTAAFILAIERVGKAAQFRRHIRDVAELTD